MDPTSATATAAGGSTAYGAQLSFMGVPGYDGVSGVPSPQEASKIDAAAAHIHSTLSGSQGLLGTSRNANLKDVQATLHGLSAPERDAVVSKLSDGDLKTLAQSSDHGGVLGAQGLSAGEKADMYRDLAHGLSGTQLARVGKSLSDPNEVKAFGSAVSGFATNDAKAGFVQGMAGSVTGSQPGALSYGLGWNHQELANPSAQAVGQVLGSLKGDATHFDAAVKGLNDEQLGAVAKAGAGASMSNIEGAQTYAYDPKTLNGMLEAAATAADPAVKARVFSAGADQLKEMAAAESPLAANPTAKDAAASTTSSLQHVMDSDTTGVTDRLQRADDSGKALTTYAQQQLAQGSSGQKALGEELKRLQFGNGLNQDPVARLNATSPGSGGQPFHETASNLGYFAGAVQAGVRKEASSAADQANLIGSVFSAGLGLATGPAGPYAGAAVKVASGAAVNAVSDAVRSGQMELAGAFQKLSLPSDPATGQHYFGAGTADYNSSANTVILSNTK